MKQKYLYTILLILSAFSLSGQVQVEINKKEFKKEKEGFKEAWKSIEGGNELYAKGGLDYQNALVEYLKALDYNNSNAELIYKIGVCYFFSGEYEKAYDNLDNACSKKNNVAIDVNYLKGQCQHLMQNFEAAIEQYKLYIYDSEKIKDENEIAKTNRLINECKNASDLIKNPVNVFIENLGQGVNSEYADYYSVVSGDGSAMYFTSRREPEKNDKQNPYDNRYFEDIYKAENIDGKWGNVQALSKPLNSENNDVLVFCSDNNTTIYLYRGNEGNGDIYESNFEKDKWSKPDLTLLPVNSKDKESSVYVTKDGQTVYFVSDREKETFGGKDIFVATKKDEKKWNKPENLGSDINTAYNEEGIYLSEKNNTIYFSSNGHNSMGGYDVFKSELLDGKWSKPENLGYPVNTPGDDVFFSISDDGRIGYYSSSMQKDGSGNLDIYKIYFLGPEKELLTVTDHASIAYHYQPITDDFVIIKEVGETKKITIIKGLVKDNETLSPIYAHIEIMDSDSNLLLYESNTDSLSGSYFVTLPAGKSYAVAVSAEGYLFQSDYLNIPISAQFEEIEKDILLSAIKEGEKLVLKNIFFESGKSALQEESFVELGFALKVFMENPKMRVEVSGHTDNVGGYQENLDLSTARAKAVKQYLIENGIDPSRLEHKGYGFSEPIAVNDTEEGRQQNRRVEFKVLSE